MYLKVLKSNFESFHIFRIKHMQPRPPSHPLFHLPLITLHAKLQLPVRAAYQHTGSSKLCFTTKVRQVFHVLWTRASLEWASATDTEAKLLTVSDQLKCCVMRWATSLLLIKLHPNDLCAFTCSRLLWRSALVILGPFSNFSFFIFFPSRKILCLCASFPSSSDVHLGSDSKIPLAALELMDKMIRQFALEYASKCLLHTSTNGVTTRTSTPPSTPPSDTPDVPLDLTVSRTTEKKRCEKEAGRKLLKQSVDFSNPHLVMVVDGVIF